MFSPQQELRLLQQRAQSRKSVKQFDIENKNGATMVQVRIRTEWVTNDIMWLLETDAVTIHSMQPTEQLNIKFDVDCTTEIEAIADILDD